MAFSINSRKPPAPPPAPAAAAPAPAAQAAAAPSSNLQAAASPGTTNGHLENATSGTKGPQDGGRGGMTGEFGGDSAFELPKEGQSGVVLNPDDLFA